MSPVKLIPLATSSDQCIKCSELISENQSSLQCDTCMLNIHSGCLHSKNPNRQSTLNNAPFTCNKCSQCPVCSKKVAKNHKAILCDLCNTWVHIKCNQLSSDDYEQFKINPNLNFTCLQCTHSIFPFISLNNKQFYTYADTGVILNEDSDLGLDPSPEQKLLMDKITNQLKSYRFDISDVDGDDDFEEVSDCKYYLPDDFKKENFSKFDNFSILHLNVHSIERHIDEIQVLLNLLKFEFDVLCFSESKIMEGTNPKTSINLEGYQDPVGMHTKATKGGVLIYVKNGISFVPRNDLDIQKDKKLESCFIEIQNPNHHNSIVGVVYRHPTMDECEFINDHLSELTHRLSKENKPLFITGDWNFNLLEFSNHEETLKFYETMMSNLLAPAITIPTRISNSGRGTLIDNIFTNSILPDKTSGNLSVNISDHLPSFLIVPVENKCTNTQKKTQYKRDTKNFSKDDFIMDYLDIDWNSELEIDKNDVNHTTDIFFTKMCAIIDKHMPLRKLTIKERKQQSKPWITPAIVAKINVKNKL